MFGPSNPFPDIGKKIAYRANRDGVAERFPDASVQSNVALDLKLINAYDDLLGKVELEILRHAKHHDAQAFHLLDSVPGIGKILGLVILYEVHDIRRFPRVQDFVSYCPSGEIEERNLPARPTAARAPRSGTRI